MVGVAGTAAFLLVALAPGSVLFRAPVLARDTRARLAIEERAYWSLVISLAITLTITMALAAAGAYRFHRLLLINGVITAAALVWWRTKLLYRATAARPGWTLMLPMVLVTLGLRFFFPPAEYIIGGKDPGTYMNEGIQIAQRGTLVVHDPVVAAVPVPFRDLFFPSYNTPGYYSIRFMGFYLIDPDTGAVVGQFPHLYPASIAVAYGIDGLTGARRASGFWAIVGLLALYFAGARLVGGPAAAAGAALLAMHVVQIWYARYPNAELTLQALLFASLLAVARAQIDDDRFFEPVAGLLLSLLLFVRGEGALALVVAGVAMALAGIDGRRLPRMLLAFMGVGLALAAWYWTSVVRAYGTYQAMYYTWNLGIIPLAGSAVTALALAAIALWARRRPDTARRVRDLIPMLLSVVVLVAAAYAYFLRTPGGGIAPHDALALRTVTAFYLFLPGLVAALLGFVLLVRRRFWRDPATFLLVSFFALFFFYKIRIVPEHFWMARRFLPAVLPAALLFAASAALVGLETRARWTRAARLVIGIAFLSLLGQQYLRASDPVRHHVEYAGIIPKLEQLASRFKDDDLVIVESRAASDTHVLALPLAYIYARQVLVLNTPVPDKGQFQQFLEWARHRYRNVYFLGGGGTDLLSRSIGVSAVTSDRFQVPEYDSPVNAYPRRVEQKEFEYGLYRFVTPRPEATWFTLDVGTRDDLHVVRFHAKEVEVPSGTSFRWTRDVSYVSIVNPLPDSRLLTLWMKDGGRPATVPAAEVKVLMNGTLLGSAIVRGDFKAYSFVISPEVASSAALSEKPARLRIESSLWNPRKVIGSGDDRQLGVMIDRIEVR
ncbi:MAG: hypothetical protein HY654_01410 [Acidobacteria bacterium]|nr:hypothetical protein [Acidobacteriota bacterium]